MTQVTILGSTGSVGINVLDVIAQHPQDFQVFALCANTNAALLLEQCKTHRPRYAVLRDADAAAELENQLKNIESNTQVLQGEAAIGEMAAHPQTDTLVAAIVGAAGLLPTFAAIEAGKRVLLANKESLVIAGQILVPKARERGAVILPVDSEHNAIFQCLPSACQSGQTDLKQEGVRKLVLTASGGPFRQLMQDQLEQVTPAQACHHPVWQMGAKISVDSATLMNKGLELIEACWLFDMAPDQVEVVVHPNGVVHSLVEYCDGSILAQLASADMRIPIAHALSWPKRMTSGAQYLDIQSLSQLHFEPPRLACFPCLTLAREAMIAGGCAPVVLNAANEEAVAAFLAEKIRFTEIARVIENVLENNLQLPVNTLKAVLAVDQQARMLAREQINRRCESGEYS